MLTKVKPPETIEIAITGIGGQGTLFLGKLLLEAAGDNYPYASGFFNNSGNIRGGAGEYIAVLSKEEIPSPLLRQVSTVILMNPILFDKYVNKVKPGGKLFVNSDVVKKGIIRDDIEIYHIPVRELNAGIEQVLTNLIMAGACLEKEGLLSVLDVERTLEKRFSRQTQRMSGATQQELWQVNIEAFRRGVAYISGRGS